MDFSDQFIKILNAIAEKFGMSIDWASDNVLPYIQGLLARIISYEIATSIFWIALGIISIIASIILFRWGMNSNYEEIQIPAVLCSVFVIGLFTIVISVQVHDIITAIYLPETIYLEYFNKYKALVKN